MAKEKEKHAAAKHGKKRLHAITTHKADDGSFVHEHHYRDQDGADSKTFGGVSADMADLHQHMDDHLGPDAEQAQADPNAAPGGPGGAPGGQGGPSDGGGPPDGGGGPPMAA